MSTGQSRLWNDEDALLLAALSSRERAQTLLALIPPASFHNPLHRSLAQSIWEEVQAPGEPSSIVSLDSVAFENATLKAKLLELQESLEERPITPESAVEFLRELVIKRLSSRTQELRSLQSSPGVMDSTVDRNAAMADYVAIRQEIARLRGRDVTEWRALVEVAERFFRRDS